MRVVVAVAFLTFLVGNALACEYREKKSPCCDDGVGLNNDVYLFTYYAWAVSLNSLGQYGPEEIARVRVCDRLTSPKPAQGGARPEAVSTCEAPILTYAYGNSNHYSVL